MSTDDPRLGPVMSELEVVCSDGNADVRRVAQAVLDAADRAVAVDQYRKAVARNPGMDAAPSRETIANPFGPTILSADDWEAFQRQIAAGKPSPLAQATLNHGRELLRKMREASNGK